MASLPVVRLVPLNKCTVISEKGPAAPTTKDVETKYQTRLTKVGDQSEHIEIQVVSMLGIMIQL
jgi:hypothetical protein